MFGFDSFCNGLGGMEDVHARRVLASLNQSSSTAGSIVVRYQDTRMLGMDEKQQQKEMELFSLEHRAVIRICMHDLVSTPIERQDFQFTG